METWKEALTQGEIALFDYIIKQIPESVRDHFTDGLEKIADVAARPKFRYVTMDESNTWFGTNDPDVADQFDMRGMSYLDVVTGQDQYDGDCQEQK